MIPGAFGLLAFYGCLCAGVGGVLLRTVFRCGDSTPRGHFLSLALGYLVVSYAVLACGLLGWLTRLRVGLVLLALFLVGLPELVVLLRRALRTAMSFTLHPRAFRRWETLPVAVLCVHLLLNLLGALAPPTEADSLAYHLAVPLRWLDAGRIVPLVDDDVSFLVGSFEMFFTPALLFGNDRLPALLHLVFGLLLLGVVGSLARGSGSGAVVTPACILYCLPLVTFCSTVPKNDLALAFFSTLAAAGMWSAAQGTGRRRFVLAGVMAGIAFSIKTTGLVLIPILAALGSIWMARRGRGGTRIPAAMGLFTAAALLTASPWYLKNWVFTGNPFFPLLYDLVGGRHYHPLYYGFLMDVLHENYGVGRGVLEFLASPWNVTERVRHFGGMSGILGTVFLTFLPAAVWRAWRSRGLELFLLLFSAAFYATWFFVLEQQTRFLLPALPGLAIVVAAGMKDLRPKLGRVGWMVPAVLAGNVLFSLGVSILYNGQALGVVAGTEREEAYLRNRVFYYDDLRWMNGHLARDSRVLAHIRHGYYLRIPYARDSLYSLFRIGENTTPGDLALQMRAEGFTHYFRTPYHLPGDARAADLLESVLDSLGVLIYENPSSLQGYRNPLRTAEPVYTKLWEFRWDGPAENSGPYR